jgi:hypothetical protein
MHINMTTFDDFLDKATAAGPERLVPSCVVAAYKDGYI